MGKYIKRKIHLGKGVSFETNAIRPLHNWTKKQLIEEINEERKQIKEFKEDKKKLRIKANTFINEVQELFGIDEIFKRLDNLEEELDVDFDG